MERRENVMCCGACATPLRADSLCVRGPIQSGVKRAKDEQHSITLVRLAEGRTQPATTGSPRPKKYRRWNKADPAAHSISNTTAHASAPSPSCILHPASLHRVHTHATSGPADGIDGSRRGEAPATAGDRPKSRTTPPRGARSPRRTAKRDAADPPSLPRCTSTSSRAARRRAAAGSRATRGAAGRPRAPPLRPPPRRSSAASRGTSGTCGAADMSRTCPGAGCSRRKQGHVLCFESHARRHSSWNVCLHGSRTASVEATSSSMQTAHLRGASGTCRGLSGDATRGEASPRCGDGARGLLRSDSLRI